MLDEHLPRSTKPGESDQENRPSRQNDRSSTDILARPGCTDLAEPGEHVESGGDTSLGTGAGDADLVKDDSVYGDIYHKPQFEDIKSRPKTYSTNR
jgi:hypothetical protein